GAARCIGRPRLKGLDPLLYLKIPRDVSNQVFQHREGFHRLNRYRFFQRELAQSRHTHEPWHAIDFRRTRTALARFAVPSTRKVISLRGLNLIHGIQHNHTFRNFVGVIAKFTFLRITSPDSKRRCRHLEFPISVSFAARVPSLLAHLSCRQNNCCSNKPFWQFPPPPSARLLDRWQTQSRAYLCPCAEVDHQSVHWPVRLHRLRCSQRRASLLLRTRRGFEHQQVPQFCRRR